MSNNPELEQVCTAQWMAVLSAPAEVSALVADAVYEAQRDLWREYEVNGVDPFALPTHAGVQTSDYAVAAVA